MLIVGATVIGAVATRAQQEAAHVAAIAADEQRIADAALAAQEAEDDAAAAAKAAFAQALRDGPAKIAEADAALVAATWAAKEDAAGVAIVRDLLAIAVKAGDGESARAQISALPGAIARLGTLEQAQDRVFFAAIGAVPGVSDSFEKQRATTARKWCIDQMTRWNTPSQKPLAVGEFRNALPGTSNAAALAAYCPELQTARDEAAAYIADGNRRVGGDGIAPGTYRTIAPVTNCYWERHTGSGEIIENAFITHAPDGAIVTVYDGEGFSAQTCGFWERIG